MRRKGRCTFKNWEAGSAEEITDSKCDGLLRIKFEYLWRKCDTKWKFEKKNTIGL